MESSQRHPILETGQLHYTRTYSTRCRAVYSTDLCSGDLWCWLNIQWWHRQALGRLCLEFCCTWWNVGRCVCECLATDNRWKDILLRLTTALLQICWECYEGICSKHKTVVSEVHLNESFENCCLVLKCDRKKQSSMKIWYSSVIVHLIFIVKRLPSLSLLDY